MSIKKGLASEETRTLSALRHPLANRPRVPTRISPALERERQKQGQSTRRPE
jgi:hypothetical protein